MKKSDSMHFFTSITSNYLPKARVLARSVRENCAGSFFTLVMSDKLPLEFSLEREPFDEVLYIKDLDIDVPNFEMWIYMHTVVEICTAVKGPALVKLLREGKSNKVVYLDPDIAVFDTLSELEQNLNEHSVVLTPHITEPESDDKGIMDNEVCALRHGIYNLGFLAVRNTDEGMRFANWWRDRLIGYCYDDIPQGLFTDQRWADMAPAMFRDVYIERSPAYNVSTWNLSTRTVTKEGTRYFVNGFPLQFYHFSGFDSGANYAMMKQYGDTPELWELRDWYVKMQEDAGQSLYEKLSWEYSSYSNGELIPKSHRIMLRNRSDVQRYFVGKNPFLAEGECLYTWMKYEAKELSSDGVRMEDLIIINTRLQAENDRFRRVLAPFLWLRRKIMRLLGYK